MADNITATFHAFKPSGKWYTSGRGTLPLEFYKVFERHERLKIILDANGGKYPGLSGRGDEFTLVIIPDDDHPNGFPLLWHVSD